MFIGTLKRFFIEESGQAIVEYAGILAFLALVIAGFILAGNTALKPALSSAFSSIADQLNVLASGS